MKTTTISRAKFGKFTAAIAAAALLAGTAAPGVLAADYTAQLTKTIDMTAAPGAGVPHGSITFTVGTVANLPSWAAGTAVKGTAAQIKSTELTAAFTGGTANTVTVPFTFDSDDFTAPGDYIFSLTETAAGITGLTQDTAARYIVVRVVNTDPTAPDGSLEISEVNIVNADGTAKAGEITNTYAAYGLSVVKHLSGNFANAGDEFTFTIALDDPDETPHASSVTVKTGGESADFSTITGDTVTFNADGTAEVKADITGGEKIGLQQGAGLGGGQCAAAQAEIMRQGHALFAFLHSVDGVVFLHHVQDGVQAGGRGEVMQIVVQILKVHPAGLEQHFFPLFGHQRSLGAAAVAKGNGEILFDEDELLLLVQNAAVSQAITVGAQIGADGVPARQLGAQRQGALRVAVLQRTPAVGAVSLVTAPQGLQAVWAKRFRHGVASFSA